MVERDGLPAFVSWGRVCISWEKGKGGGIPRAKRDKDLKGAERMERKRGGIRRCCHRHKQRQQGEAS